MGLRMPRRSVRLRFTMLYGGLFLLSGACLLVITYILVAHQLLPVRLQARDHASPGPAVTVPGTGGIASRSSGGEVMCYVGSSGVTVAGQPAQCLSYLKDYAVGERNAELNDLLIWSGVALGIMAVASVGLGWLVAGRVLRPLRTITAAARHISASSLHQRLALTGPADELKELGDTFDGMLDRLDAAFASQRRFVANASHELRTPLTEMRTLIDITTARPAASAAQLELALAAIGAAVDKSEELIEALLTLARSDRGPGHAETVDLPTAVEDAIDMIAPAAAARQIQIGTALQDTHVTGDRILLERLVSNLIDNAVQHNVAGGWVLASTRTSAGIAELTVSNGGEHIPPDQAAGLFEPFRRLSGRAGRPAGTGLGLSIVASVATAHGGHAQAHARPGGGLDVQVTLPVRYWRQR
ncbi:MAG: HAMP domain-containing histidine kinase [Streptosporangiaceae bacterium]|nr:HAMP domain-containing histidine kinase [Streptosporangiaceae bacterium]